MRIEKVNDNQIRCTLTREDLASRNIKLSELAYGSENAKSLFRDMMQQAASEFGFEAEDIPLMIEAIPLSAETIMLIITKVESPEELDTRFSNFTDASAEDDVSEGDSLLEKDDPFDSAGNHDLLELFEQIRKEKEASKTNTASQPEEASSSSREQLTKMFAFQDLETGILVSKSLKGFYTGDSALYKTPKDHMYHLVIRQGAHSTTEFHKIYNAIAQHTKAENYTPGMEAFFKEHGKVILPDQAVQKLLQLS